MAFNPPLQVMGYIATRRGDPDRGPLVRLRSDDAALRAVVDGEFVWVYGPRRHDLAPVMIDDTVPRGGVVVRDLAGVTLSEIVRLVKATADRPVLPPSLA
jgi:anaerobic selenocysteine-containing dehydrogenase